MVLKQISEVSWIGKMKGVTVEVQKNNKYNFYTFFCKKGNNIYNSIISETQKYNTVDEAKAGVEKFLKIWSGAK